VPAHDPRSYLQRGEYYGRIAARSDGAGLRMVEVHHPRSARLPEHTHESAYFCLVLDGAYREHVGTKERVYRSFSFAFSPAAFQHRDEIGQQGGRFFTVELDAHWTRNIDALGSYASTAPTEVRDARAFGALLQLHREFCRARDAGHGLNDFSAEVLTAELIAHSLARRMTIERRPPPWLGRVVECLDAHYADPLRVGVIAAHAGVHPVYLARVFRRVYRCSMAEYQTGVRIRAACALLAKRDLTLARIALETGFADQSHFTRAFAATVRCPPGAFRRLVFPKVRFVQEGQSTAPYVRRRVDVFPGIPARTLDEHLGTTGPDQPM
jgi:AraC family transcriptional regulator